MNPPYCNVSSILNYGGYAIILYFYYLLYKHAYGVSFIYNKSKFLLAGVAKPIVIFSILGLKETNYNLNPCLPLSKNWVPYIIYYTCLVPS